MPCFDLFRLACGVNIPNKTRPQCLVEYRKMKINKIFIEKLLTLSAIWLL